MRVAVVMSTYNGQKYLREQINSILQQVDVEVELFIRDDGSNDETLSILYEYSAKHKNVHVHKGENIGFRKSFMEELKIAEGFEYYAFSDQDDFWEDEKLKKGCETIQESIQNKSKPAVYYSNLYVADEQLKIYRKTKLEKRRHTLESNVLRRSIAGCTMIFNAAMWNCINKKTITTDMLCRGHDSFIISLCYAVGGIVVCDSNAYIRYRQHSNNTSGSSHGIKQRIQKEWSVFINKKGTEPKIAESILKNWNEDLDHAARKSLTCIAKCNTDLHCRIKILFSPAFTTGDLRLTALGKLKVAMGII